MAYVFCLREFRGKERIDGRRQYLKSVFMPSQKPKIAKNSEAQRAKKE